MENDQLSKMVRLQGQLAVEFENDSPKSKNNRKSLLSDESEMNVLVGWVWYPQ